MRDYFSWVSFLTLAFSLLFLEGCNRKTYEEAVFETLFIKILNDPDVLEGLYNMDGVGRNDAWPMYFEDFNFLVAPDIFSDTTRTGVIYRSSLEEELEEAGENSLYISDLDQLITKPRECSLSPMFNQFVNPDQELRQFLSREQLSNVSLGNVINEANQTVFIQLGAPIECNDVLFQWVQLSPNGNEDLGVLISFTLEKDSYRLIHFNW